MDKLDKIFELQKLFDDKVIEERNLEYDLDTWLQKDILAMLSELGELLDETNFKWWKNPKALNRDLLKGELIDILHFFISMCLKLDITPQELYEAYLDKNKENFLRQEGRSQKQGYAVPTLLTRNEETQ
ncbi:MAG: dUTPase [Clostridia bacterium]|nr:dUTPase [Clostridia bacterium]